MQGQSGFGVVGYDAMYSCGWLTVFWRNIMPVGPSETFPTFYWTARCQNCKTVYRISSPRWEPQLRCKDWSRPWSVQLLSRTCPASIQPSTTPTGCWLGKTLRLSTCSQGRYQVSVSMWRTTWDRRILTYTTFLTTVSWKSITGTSTSHCQISQQQQNVGSVWSAVFNFGRPDFHLYPVTWTRTSGRWHLILWQGAWPGVEQVMQAFHSYTSWSYITFRTAQDTGGPA